MKLQKFLFFIIFVFLFNSIHANSQKDTDSLKSVLTHLEGKDLYQTHLSLGMNYYHDDKLLDAIVHLKKYLNYCLKNELNKEALNTYNNIGKGYKLLGDLDLALDNFNMAKEQNQKVKNKLLSAYIHNNIGSVLSETGCFDEAMEDYFLVSVEIYKELGLTKSLATAYNNIGIAYARGNKYDSAIVYFSKSIALHQQLDYTSGISKIYTNLGYTYLQMNEIEKAFPYLNQAYEIDLNNKESKTFNYSATNIAEYYIATKDLNLAKKYADIALKNSLLVKDKSVLTEIYRILSYIYYETGSFKNSRDYLLKHYLMKDSVLNNDVEKKVDYLHSKYEIELKNEQLTILQSEKKLQELRYNTERNWLILIIISFSISIIILLYFVKQKSKMEQANIKLVGKNLEILKIEDTIIDSNRLAHKNQKETKSEFTTSKYKNSSLNQHQKNDLIDVVLELFDQQKPYLDEEFSLSKLSSIIGSNNTYLSQAINEHFDKNFNNWINEYRIKEAMRLLSQKNRRFSIEGIAKDVGFRSKSTFNAAFKNYTGVTPTTFEKSHPNLV